MPTRCCIFLALLSMTACRPAGFALPGSTPADGAGAVVSQEEEPCVYQRKPVETLLALGSSSVAGAGASDPAHCFVNLVARDLDTQNLLNLGAGGQRAVDVIGAIAGQARAALAQVVVVMAFSDYAYSDGETMIEAWRQILQPIAEDGAQIYFGDLQIDPLWICGPIATSTGECYDLATANMIGAKNALARQVLAPIPNVHLVQVFDENAAHPEWILPDGHFNDAGHAHLAKVFLQDIAPDFLGESCADVDAGGD